MTNPIVAGGSLEVRPRPSRMRYFDRNILIKGDPRHQVRPGRIRRVLREVTQPDCRQPLLELRSVGSEP